MSVDQPIPLGPAVREVIRDDQLVEVAVDDGTVLLRPEGGRDLAVLRRSSPDTVALLDQADRLLWLGGEGPAPAFVASSRSDQGDEEIVVQLGTHATAASLGHPMGPEALVEALAASLRSLHERSTVQCPFVADTPALRIVVDERINRGAVAESAAGPYAGRSPAALAEIFDGLMEDLGEADDPVCIHSALASTRIWLDPSGEVTFLGWQSAGLGDRHVDLAAVASMLTELHGPALVAPFFEAYGFEHVDLRRLDAHQLLAHLLS